MIRPNSYHRKKPYVGGTRPSMAALLAPTEPVCSRCGGPGAILRTRAEWHGKKFVRIAAALVCPCCSYENHPIMRLAGHVCPHRKRRWDAGLGFSAFYSGEPDRKTKG